jgi:DNA-binding MarR family transcriptional regulator
MAEQLRLMGDPGSEAFRLETYPFYQVNRVLSRYNLIIERELRKIDIDIPTWRVLMILGERAPRSIGQISRAGVVNLSTMMRIVERMVNAGLVERAPSAIDARVIDVNLTTAGRERLAEARVLMAPVYRQALSGFSERDFERLLTLLGRLNDNLEAMAE